MQRVVVALWAVLILDVARDFPNVVSDALAAVSGVGPALHQVVKSEALLPERKLNQLFLNLNLVHCRQEASLR